MEFSKLPDRNVPAPAFITRHMNLEACPRSLVDDQFLFFPVDFPSRASYSRSPKLLVCFELTAGIASERLALGVMMPKILFQGFLSLVPSPLQRHTMKSLLFFLLLAAIPAFARETSPLTVAVLPFESSDEQLSAKAAEAASLLATQLSTKPELWLLERADIEKILAEQTMKLSGLTDPASAVQVGKLLGAKVLVTGRLIRSGAGAILVAKVMSTETSRVFGEISTANAPDALQQPAFELADKVAALLTKQNVAFRVPVITREERIARLKKSLDGKKLPTVMVTITERDLTRPAVDPAVETEFKKSLLELGFEVIDPQSGKAPDVVIKGEAFSETSARRGQLVSARARAEVEATRSSDNKVLAVDRETTSAVDTAPATAGKTALEDAGLILLERTVPKIVGQ